MRSLLISNSNNIQVKKKIKTIMIRLRKMRRLSRMKSLRRVTVSSLIQSQRCPRRARKTTIRIRRRHIIPMVHLRQWAIAPQVACPIFPFRPSIKLAKLVNYKCLSTWVFHSHTRTTTQQWHSTNSIISLAKCPR